MDAGLGNVLLDAFNSPDEKTGDDEPRNQPRTPGSIPAERIFILRTAVHAIDRAVIHRLPRARSAAMTEQPAITGSPAIIFIARRTSGITDEQTTTRLRKTKRPRRMIRDEKIHHTRHRLDVLGQPFDFVAPPVGILPLAHQATAFILLYLKRIRIPAPEEQAEHVSRLTAHLDEALFGFAVRAEKHIIENLAAHEALERLTKIRTCVRNLRSMRSCGYDRRISGWQDGRSRWSRAGQNLPCEPSQINGREHGHLRWKAPMTFPRGCN